jgi:hypothetical protein
MADETQPLLSTERRPRKDGVASGKHFPFETFWLEHRDWLEEQGYKLRARYQPGWRASWLEPGSKPWFKCEDAIVQTVYGSPAQPAMTDLFCLASSPHGRNANC